MTADLPIVSAPGKLILIGEYGVLAGGPAVVAAVDRRVIGRFLPGAAPATPLVKHVVDCVRAHLLESGETPPDGTPELDSATVGTLRALVSDLPRRFAEVARCGIPDTLVHGDFHPGNTRGSPDAGGRSVLLDWGDCGMGHPLLDQAAFLSSIAEHKREPVRAAWAALWRDALPGCEPDRAAELLAPVAALRQALIYRTFLDGIEPDERVYHASDPGTWLRRAAELAAV